MIIKCTLKELEDLNLLKSLFILRGWTPETVKRSNPLPKSLDLLILVDYIFEVKFDNPELMTRYTDAIPYILKINEIELTEEECKELGLCILFEPKEELSEIEKIRKVKLDAIAIKKSKLLNHPEINSSKKSIRIQKSGKHITQHYTVKGALELLEKQEAFVKSSASGYGLNLIINL
jgi:hypothetical protein